MEVLHDIVCLFFFLLPILKESLQSLKHVELMSKDVLARWEYLKTNFYMSQYKCKYKLLITNML